MSAAVPPSREHEEQTQNIAAAIAAVSDRATLLVREEIELAKAEVTEKAIKFGKGAIVGIVAGVFFVMALVFLLVGFAYLIYYYLPVNLFAFFWGFFAMSLILVVLGILAGWIAARFLKRGAPPVPTMAIDEARKIRDTVNASVEDPPAAVPMPVVPPTPGGEV